ncbi:hypothetical protein [Nonomuraea sp. NPDC049646]|uniref:hypothetical protein n=1 Tax=unclassified Nonomuraea TaxID=2593643 RepID=UPI003787A4A4
MDQQQGYEVPLDALLSAVEEQRNAALTQAAQMRALATQFKAERDQLAAEVEKLRADASEQTVST